MTKGIILSDHELKVKKLEDKIKEIEQANLILQEYFTNTSEKYILQKNSSPFNGHPVFSDVFNFTIDLNIQKLVWLNAKNKNLGISHEKLFLKDINSISTKLLVNIDRKRFKSIILQYTHSTVEAVQTILRIKHPEKKFIWVLACFERVSFHHQIGNYLQVKFIKLEENKDMTELFYEFLKKTEKKEQYQKVELLTFRQREILSLIGKGLTSKEIASKLNISFHTVEAHRKAIAKKTQTRKRAALISLAAEVGII